MDRDLSPKTQLYVLWYKILDVSPAKRADLTKIHRKCESIWTEMDKEFINCRRASKLSPKYQELEQDLQESLNTLEQYLVFATLLGD